MRNKRELALKLIDNEKTMKRLAIKFTSDPEEIQELVQDTMVRSLKFIEQYFDNPKIVSWLFVIMKNTYISNYRKWQKKIRFEKHERTGQQPAGHPASSDTNGANHSLLLADIHNLLAKYPEEYQDIFSYHCDGFKYRELAMMYEIPEGTVKTRIFTIRKHLRNKLSTLY